MRKENPDVYENLTPLRVRHIMDAGVAGVLKDRAPDGSRILVIRPGIFYELKKKEKKRVKNLYYIYIYIFFF